MAYLIVILYLLGVIIGFIGLGLTNGPNTVLRFDEAVAIIFWPIVLITLAFKKLGFGLYSFGVWLGDIMGW